MSDQKTSILIRHFGLVAYPPVYQAMQTFTDTRQPQTLDELWVLQHFPVYTLGQAGLPKHLLQTGEIPIYHIDRGGQVTYHGLSFNINMDLTPFQGINPCGYQGLQVTQLSDLGIHQNIKEVTGKFLHYLLIALKKRQLNEY